MVIRVLLVAAMWASLVIGAMQLLHGAAVPAGVAAGVLAGILGARALVVARSRVRRLRSWPRPGDPAFPSGPRRVLLSETSLAGPR